MVVFWGESFRRWFCRYPLSSLLAPNNIPALASLPNTQNSRFLVCTTLQDWLALQVEPQFQLLSQYIQAEFVPLPEVTPKFHKYVWMSIGHRLLLARCFEQRAIAVYVAADTIVPDGAVREVARLLGEGKRVGLCTAVRFSMEGVDHELKVRGYRVPGHPLVLSNREAVAIGLRNLHPEARAGNWAASNFGALAWQHNRQDFLSCCYWEVPGEDGVIIFTHNWAPFFIDFSFLSSHDDSTLESWAIDGDYVYRNFQHAEVGKEVHVVADSDSLFLLGLTPERDMVPKISFANLWKSAPVVGKWSKGFILNQTAFDRHTDPLRRRIYNHRVRWHARDLSPAWHPVERVVDDVEREYLQRDFGSFIGSVNSMRSQDGHGAGWRLSRAPRAFWYLAFLWPRAAANEFMRRPEQQRTRHLVNFRIHLAKQRIARFSATTWRRVVGRRAVRRSLILLRAGLGDRDSRARVSRFVREHAHRFDLRI
jgi:hypothetical protein